jgi:hypothetical protein
MGNSARRRACAACFAAVAVARRSAVASRSTLSGPVSIRPLRLRQPGCLGFASGRPIGRF